MNEYTDGHTGDYDPFMPTYAVMCSICGQTYSGWHSCPGYKWEGNNSGQPPFPVVIRQAWVCPLCNRANAPHVDRCDCVELERDE